MLQKLGRQSSAALRVAVSAATAVVLSSAFHPLAAQQCPNVEALRRYRPPEATRVYAVDGSRIADLSPERRVVVDLKDVPTTVSNGFVAVEDRRLYGGTASGREVQPQTVRSEARAADREVFLQARHPEDVHESDLPE